LNRFEITAKSFGTVDESYSVTIRAIDRFSNTVPLLMNITLAVNGSATGAGTILLQEGLGGAIITNTKPETIALSLHAIGTPLANVDYSASKIIAISSGI
jgi:hypothetical protein